MLNNFVLRGSLILFLMLFFALLKGQKNLILNGGFEKHCERGSIRIDGQSVSDSVGANFFIDSPGFRSGNASPKYWSCNTNVQNKSSFWFLKDGNDSIHVFLKLLGFSKLHGRNLDHQSKSITGSLARTLKKGEIIRIQTWSKVMCPYQLDSIALSYNFIALEKLDNQNSHMTGGASIVNVTNGLGSADYEVSESMYHAVGGETSLRISISPRSNDDFEKKELRMIMKKTKKNKRLNHNRYNYIEVNIDSIAITSITEPLKVKGFEDKLRSRQ